MNELKEPIDFIFSNREFEDQDLENLFQLPIKDLTWVICSLKENQIKAKNKEEKLFDRINKLLKKRKEAYNECANQSSSQGTTHWNAGIIEDLEKLLK